MNWLNFLFSIFLNERGEEGQGNAKGNSSPGTKIENDSQIENDSNDSQKNISGEKDNLEKDEDIVDPKYGDFGDNPTVDDVYNSLTNSLTELNDSHGQLKEKTTRTEKNLAALRNSIEGSGYKILMDTDGDVQLVKNDVPAKGKKTLRFTEKHADLWDKETLESVRFLIQDGIEEGIENYKTETEKKAGERDRFISTRRASNQQMAEIYPQINPAKGNINFDKNFHSRATEIWEKKYQNLPNGELIAAHEAALEMGISSAKMEKVKKSAYQQGKEGKRVLGPVGTRAKVGEGTFRSLTKDEYFALSSTEQEKYNKQQVLKR